MAKENLIKLEQLYKSGKAININNKFIKRILGFEDMRDFFEAIHSWGFARDFTYSALPEDFQKFLRAFIRETYLDK